MRPRKVKGEWVYSHSEDVLAAAHLQPISVYTARRRQTVLKAIEDRPILEECRRAERRRGSPARQYWWEQEFDLSEEEIVGASGPHITTDDQQRRNDPRRQGTMRRGGQPTELARATRDLSLTDGQDAELERRLRLAALPQ